MGAGSRHGDERNGDCKPWLGACRIQGKECGIRFVRAGIKRASANMTAEDMNAIVEAAKEDGGWIVFMTHGVARGYDAWKNSEELRKHFKWIKDQKDVRVMTFSAANEVNCCRRVSRMLKQEY